MENSRPVKKFSRLRFVGRLLLLLLLLFLLTLLFIRSPWGQDIIVQRVITHLSEKTGTVISLDRLFITFDGDISMQDLYVEDLSGDTLFFSRSLKVDLPLWPIITGQGIGVDEMHWDGMKAFILRKDSTAGYNFDFLIDAFVTDSTQVSVSDTAASKPMEIMLGLMEFSDFDLRFKDDVMGIDSRVVLEELTLDVQTFDMAAMEFRIKEARLSGLDLNYVQTKVLPNTASESDSPSPKIFVEVLVLERIKAHYDSRPDGLIADADIAHFQINNPNIDLDASSYEVAALQLSDSRISIQSNTLDAMDPAPLNVTASDSTMTFQWPDIILDIRKVELNNNEFSFSKNGAVPHLDQFNPEAIDLIGLNLSADRLRLKEGALDMEIQALSFHEASGLDLKELGFALALHDTSLDLSELVCGMAQSRMSGSLQADYPSIQTLIEDPASALFHLNLTELQLDINDVFRFDPSLKENEQLEALSRHPIKGHIEVNGSLAELHFINNLLTWGSATEISFNGILEHAMISEELQFDFPDFILRSSRADALRFVNEESLGIRLPDGITLKADLHGGMNDLQGAASLQSDLGNITVQGHAYMAENISYEIAGSVSDLQLNKLLKDEQLGALNMTLSSTGKGSDLQTLNADMEANVQQFIINGYSIKDLQLSGTMLDGRGQISSRYKDYNLNATLDGIIRLDTVSPMYSMNLDVIGIDMEALGLSKRPLRAALNLNASYTGKLEDFDLEMVIDKATFVSSSDAYQLGRVEVSARVSADSTSAMIRSDLIDLELFSNTDPTTFSQAVLSHLRGYFDSDTIRPASSARPVRIKVDGSIAKSPILSEVFLNKLQEMDTVHIAIDFDEQKRLLNAEIYAPHIDYDGYQLDSLYFTMDTNAEEFDFNLGFSKVAAGPLLLKHTRISGREAEGRLDLFFDSFDNDEPLIHMQSALSGDEHELRYHIDPEGLLFNKEPWSIPAENEVFWDRASLRFTDFVLSNDRQSIALTDTLPGIEKDHLALVFQHFELADFLSYLNPDEELAAGQLQGNLIIEEPFGNLGFMADLDIAGFKMLNVDLGKLRLDATSKQLDSYDFNMSLTEGQVDLTLNGEVTASGSSPSIDLTLDVKRLDMLAFEQFASSELTASKGSLSAQFSIQGELNAPAYSGQVHFADAGFKVVKLNSEFSLPDEQFSVNNKGLKLAGFRVLDANGNSFDLSGDIFTPSLLKPEFDLKLKAKGFQILNASKDDNNLFYGLVVFDAEGSVKGDLDIPILDLTLTVDPRTDATYNLPTSVAEVERMDGVVIFVNREDPDAILTRSKEVTATLSGFDVKALLRIDKQAKVTMILDEETGDNFQISGTGDLRFGMEPNGRMSLAGVYNVSSGSYEMNLYGLVNRKFELSPGSKVSWSGDPFDAKIDLRAIYRQEASSAPLMASVTSGLDPAAKSRYRQVLPFYVYLDISGSLEAPEISFALDMPEDEKGALDGQVYARLLQVNNQEEELNKQVFSLLVLNRFYPQTGSDGSTGGVSSVARDNLNDALSDQLNVFSDKLLGQTGVQLDFGLDTYTDYQGTAPTERTQLEVAAKKSLFNDRLSVSVGSDVDIEGSGSATDEATPLIGKVSIEYTLTPDGRYRLKGFRRNEYLNVIDGQTVVSGIALIFTQEFNAFSELWRAMLKQESLKDEAK